MNVVVKAMMGNYDWWVDPLFVDDDTDYILFTDQDIDSEVYEVRKIPATPKIERLIKIQPWDFVGDEYDRYIWMDANIYPRTKIEGWNDIDITCLEHPHRNCVYDELQACIQLKKDDPKVMIPQVQRYRSEGYPEKGGMVQTGLMVRKLNDVTEEHAELWAKEVREGSRRDQLSFFYACWLMQIKPSIQTISWDDFLKIYKYIPHRR